METTRMVKRVSGEMNMEFSTKPTDAQVKTGMAAIVDGLSVSDFASLSVTPTLRRLRGVGNYEWLRRLASTYKVVYTINVPPGVQANSIVAAVQSLSDANSPANSAFTQSLSSAGITVGTITQVIAPRTYTATISVAPQTVLVTETVTVTVTVAVVKVEEKILPTPEPVLVPVPAPASAAKKEEDSGLVGPIVGTFLGTLFLVFVVGGIWHYANKPYDHHHNREASSDEAEAEPPKEGGGVMQVDLESIFRQNVMREAARTQEDVRVELPTE